MLFTMSAAYLLTGFFQPEPWAPVLAVVIAYAVVATGHHSGSRRAAGTVAHRPRRGAGAVARPRPDRLPDSDGRRSPGFLHYRLVPATGPAVGVAIWPPGFGGLEGRVVERRDATVAITAGPDVQPELVEVIAWTLAPRPHLFQGVPVGGGR